MIAVALLGAATQVFAQARRIQGKVVDEHGTPVTGALIETVMVALPDVEFGVRRTDETWKARTNADGNYIVTVPGPGQYLVTVMKDGVGRDQTKVAVQRSGIVTANLTIWNPPAATIASKDCGTSRTFGAFKQSPHTAAADPGLVRLIAWLEAVGLHTPGCKDAPSVAVSQWTRSDLETLLRDVRELVTFLRRAEDERAEWAGSGGAQRDQLVLVMYGRRIMLFELQQVFYGDQPLRANDLLRRGAVLHADIGIFVPGDLGRYPLVADGDGRGWRGRSLQWEVGRLLLDSITPAASADAGAQLWYRAVTAHLFRDGNLAELPSHLNRARQVFPQSADVWVDSAYLHHVLSSPAIQASVQQLRANDVSVAIGSRTSELERAERFFREALAIAPDDADARLRLGHALSGLGRRKEAALELRKAIDAKPDGRRTYLAVLLLGREEEALGRRDEARRRYEQAAGLYPSAQSPRLALSRLAQHTGDRAGAQLSLRNLVRVSGRDPSDPWWEFYEPHKEDADILVTRMRQIGR